MMTMMTYAQALMRVAILEKNQAEDLEMKMKLRQRIAELEEMLSVLADSQGKTVSDLVKWVKKRQELERRWPRKDV